MVAEVSVRSCAGSLLLASLSEMTACGADCTSLCLVRSLVPLIDVEVSKSSGTHWAWLRGFLIEVITNILLAFENMKEALSAAQFPCKSTA